MMSEKWVPRFSIGIIIAFLAIAVGMNSSFAGTTGKVSGLVVDASTGEAIPGVSVVIEGTRLGAITDLNGQYFIIGVPPGEYTVKAIMMGYRSVEKTKVRVIIDRTSEVNFELESTAIELPSITVEAKKELVPMDVSSSQTAISGSEIVDLPIDRFEDITSTVPGVKGAEIRGGKVDETLLVLDDFPLVDELYNVPYMALNLTAIKDIEILTSGFNAEYGNVRSGVVNVVTKEGGDNFSGAIDYRYVPAYVKHYGPKVFGEGGYDWRIYGRDESLSPVVDTKGDTVFIGWKRWAENFLSNDDPKDDITPRQALELWRWRHRPIRYADRPDQYLDASSGCLLPG